MSSLPAIADDGFQKEVMESELPVLVDFWAAWCAPCRALGPVIEDLGKSYEGKVKFVKMDVEENKKTPVKFRIRSIPTLILFKNGKVVEQIVGNVPREKIEGILEKVL